MTRLSSLKRFARTRVDQLSLELPVFTWERVDDPVKLNAIFSEKEWKLDSPVSNLTQFRQDWIHWFECDPADETYVEIFFRRLHEQVALVWVRLRVNHRLFVLSEAFYKDNSAGHVYSAGGVRLECTSPMRGWRLALNLIMDEPATGAKVHVRLGGQVAMTGHTLELPKQVRPSFLARRFYREENIDKAKHEISKCCMSCQAIMQPNSVFTEIVIDGRRQEMLLFGSRLKCFGNSTFLEGVPIHVGYAENGTTFTAIRANEKAYGYCCNPSDYVSPIRKTRWSQELALQRSEDSLGSLHFEAAGRPHELNFGASRTTVGQVGCLSVDDKTFKMQSTVLEHLGVASFQTTALSKEKLDLVKLLRFPSPQKNHLILSVWEPDCKNPKLTGGKGSSLAVLTDISKHLKSFTVPAAVVLTVNAYSMFAEIPEVATALEVFLEASKKADMAALKLASDECVAAISGTVLPGPIVTLLKEKLQEVFGFAWFSKKFAVRSSAVGEDSEEMSAAGQMTTFLGVRGERKISAAIVKCWASQFALTAINYKRQYGQDLNSSMAVVVQEMVSADTAGVMFTCDPVTSDPSGIFITANFGLGESVVSATADPDTFSFRRQGDKVELVSKSCGAKDRMVVELEFGNGTEEKAVAEEDSRTLCLTDELAIRIASIGAALSDVTDSARDIEWAVVRRDIYLLQSRPVTSFFRESDFEIRHDYNSGFYTNREILSRANLDEVMPGAFSTLGVSIVARLLFAAVNKTRTEWGGTDQSQFVDVQNCNCGKKMFMNFSQKGLANNKTIMRSSAITMFGYDISEHEAIKSGIVHGAGAASGWGFTKLILNAVWTLKKTVKMVQEEAEKITIDIPENADSLAQFMSILRQVPKMDFFMEGLMNASMPSAGRPHELNFGASRTTVGQVGCLSVDDKTFKMQSTVLEHLGVASFQTTALSKEKLDLVKLLRFPSPQKNHLILSVWEPDCKNPKLTGGKGSSLAVLTDISKHLKSFTVPAAVVLTVNAYSMFAEIPEVATALEVFLEASKKADMAALKLASDECVAAISGTVLPGPIVTLLKEKLQEVFGFAWFSKKFAVRSSAVGEDSEEMSAAGQMTTFLGVRGERKISAAIVKCWASQFALTAINYKRQYGQDLNSSMAVVVQEMVSADTAGVMFTCDPVTSDPSGIFITANFGLGESVVSATADPDTFSFRRQGDKVELVSKSCGAKDRMVVELEFGNGTEEKAVAEEDSRTLCLTDELAIRIASIGAALSDVTDSARDIEWAVVRRDIYLLQSRPVTSFFRESDFEIRHDYNSGFYTNREILSRANLDEVMPGAFSTLGVSIVARLLFAAVNKTRTEWGGTDQSQFVDVQNCNCGKKMFMNFSQKGLANNKTIMRSSAITMFGYDISEHEAIKSGIVHGAGAASGWGFTKLILNAVWTLKKTVKMVQEEAEKITIDIPENADSLAQFMSILRQVPKMDFFMEGLMNASMPSGIYNMFTLNVIRNSQSLEDFSPELMILHSKLLRSDLQVESAHIPTELTSLSNLLREDPMAAEFLAMSPEEALKWLEIDSGAAAKQFRTIRSKHAHRCYKEFDVHAKTWDIDPIPLVQTLQSTVRCPEPTKPRKGEECLSVDQLPKRPSLMQRRYLNYLIPRAKYAVYAREAAKSALVKSVHQIRLALRKVGLRLQAEGRLPDPELIFFLNCDEVYRLITTKDPSLLPRALRRQKMHPVLDQERFPVLFCGVPKPIDSSAITIDPNAQSLEGTPVSEGVVVGPARVILDFLSEAHLIQRGEILITRATDTGWTPYFPLLGGVVTEVGGLLSHGAVVAREYGLPAIVGLIGVTEFVRSGDIVTLDGNKGILHKSPSPQPSQEEELLLPVKEEVEEPELPSTPNGNVSAAGGSDGTSGAQNQAEDSRNGAGLEKKEEKVETGQSHGEGSVVEEFDSPMLQNGTSVVETGSSDTSPLIECEA